jgi:hypothetical protein
MGLKLGWETKVDRWRAWIQIKVDMHEGLHEEIELVWYDISFKQQIY